MEWWKQKKKVDKVARGALPAGITRRGDKYVSFVFQLLYIITSNLTQLLVVPSQIAVFMIMTVNFSAGTHASLDEAESALAVAKGLVEAYIASNPTKRGAEVSKWWQQKKTSYDYKLRNEIPLLDELSTTNPAFDIPNDHSLSQIIRETRTNFSLYKAKKESPFTADHFEILAEIGFTFVDNTKAKKARQSTATKPKTKRAKKVQSISDGYKERWNSILPPLSPVYDMAAV